MNKTIELRQSALIKFENSIDSEMTIFNEYYENNTNNCRNAIKVSEEEDKKI